MGQDDPTITEGAVDRYEQEHSNAIAIRSLDDIKRLSLIFVESGMFKPDRNLNAEQRMYQAGVKIIAGVEFGIQPFAAMRGINIINGNAEMSANLMAAKVKTHPKYDYRVTKWDGEGCTIKFFELPSPKAPRSEWDELGESSFTKEDAQAASLNGDNWRKFARNMYFARAMSNGVRIYCPDVFYGAPVYTEGEIGGEFTAPEEQRAVTQSDDAEPIEGELVVEVPEPELRPVEEPETEEAPSQARNVVYMTEPQRRKLMATLKDLDVTTKDERNEIISNIIMRDIESVNELTKEEAGKAIDELSNSGVAA